MLKNHKGECMRKSLTIFCLMFLVLTIFSFTAEAGIRLYPNPLVCPNTSAGEEVDCGTFSLQNNNILLGIKVENIKIGDTTNYTLDAS